MNLDLDSPKSTVEQLHRGFRIDRSVWYISTFLSISLSLGPQTLEKKPSASSSSWQTCAHGKKILRRARGRPETRMTAGLSGVHGQPGGTHGLQPGHTRGQVLRARATGEWWRNWMGWVGRPEVNGMTTGKNRAEHFFYIISGMVGNFFRLRQDWFGGSPFEILHQFGESRGQIHRFVESYQRWSWKLLSKFFYSNVFLISLKLVELY